MTHERNSFLGVDGLARNRSRGRRRGESHGKWGILRNCDGRSLCAGLILNGNRRDEHQRYDSHGRIWSRVASLHRAIVSHGSSLGVAIALIFLEIATLTMVQRAVNRIATCRQVGGGKRFGQRGNTREQQPKQRRDGGELSCKASQSHAPKHTRDPCPNSTVKPKCWPQVA